jgi:hypothetical protein
MYFAFAIAFATAVGVKVGFAFSRSAAVPATKGALNEVPELDA